MFKHAIRSLLFTIVCILQITFFLSSAMAEPVRLPSGQTFDVTSKQLEMLKHKPGVAFFPFQPPDEVTNCDLTPLMHVELPEALGGGFLIGTPENILAGLNDVGAAIWTKKKIINETVTSEAKIQKQEDSIIASKFELSAGYRVGDLDWNIAGDTAGENPNILSELTWSDLEIYQVKLRNVTIMHKILYFRGSLAYGWITGGENQDSDFNGDNRTLEYSRSNNSGDDGNVLDASLGIGYPFTF